jgi:hypothetical protein
MRVKGLDFAIHGNGIVSIHITFEDGQTRHLKVKAANAPHITRSGAPDIPSHEHLRKADNIIFYYPAIE